LIEGTERNGGRIWRESKFDGGKGRRRDCAGLVRSERVADTAEENAFCSKRAKYVVSSVKMSNSCEEEKGTHCSELTLL
jgi:hypothetical protein